MTERLHGILPVLQTAIGADNQLDMESMNRQVAFCIEAGAHGLVFPVLASEFQFLSDGERQRLVELVIEAASGQIPVIVGVAGSTQHVAMEHAAFARKVGADAVVAMPPYIAIASPDELFAYYKAIAAAAELPVIVQHSPHGPGMDVAFLQRLLSEVEQIRYVKEEMEPSAHNISTLVAAKLESCWGIFGGAWCRWMMSELERGATGFMPSVEVVDIHVRIWNTFQSGDKEEARKLFNQLAPFIHLTFNLGLRFVKEVLVRRGVFKTARMRQPGVLKLDAADHRELDIVLGEIDHLLTIRNKV